jgi:membrane-bound ClpP family serine protease
MTEKHVPQKRSTTHAVLFILVGAVILVAGLMIGSFRLPVLGIMAIVIGGVLLYMSLNQKNPPNEMEEST